MNPKWLALVDAAKGSEWLSSDSDAMLALASVGAGDAVLDLGCGYGRLTERLLPQCRLVVACDLNQKMLAVLRERLGPSQGLRIVHGSVEDCADDAPFRAALLANHVLGNQSKRSDAVLLARVREMLADGGRAVISGLNPYQVVHALTYEGRGVFCSAVDYRRAHCIDHVEYDWTSSELHTHRVVYTADGPVEDDFTVRLYFPTELDELVIGAGFRSCSIFGDELDRLTAGSQSMYCLAQV